MLNSRLDVVFEDRFGRFNIYYGSGGANTPLGTFSPAAADGTGLSDTLALSNKPARLFHYDGVYEDFAPWQNIGPARIPGPKAIMWAEPFEFWCVSDKARPRNRWCMEGRAHPMAAGEEAQFYLYEGDVLYTTRLNEVYYADRDGDVTVTAPADQVLIVIHPVDAGQLIGPPNAN